jgi:hypothetical protein
MGSAYTTSVRIPEQKTPLVIARRKWEGNIQPLEGEAQLHNHFQKLFLISMKEHSNSVTDKSVTDVYGDNHIEF